MTDLPPADGGRTDPEASGTPDPAASLGATDLECATLELYALTPAGFTARRSELVAQARTQRSKGLAKEISGLRRPTVSAWLVNQLARGVDGAGRDVQNLEELGRDLRAAAAELDGPRIKELAKRRQQVLAALVRRAEAIGDDHGQQVGPGIRRELEETLGAAVADEQAAAAVTSGRLTRALVYAGFGEVDVTAATATAVTARPRHLHSAPKLQPEQGDSSPPTREDENATAGRRAAAAQRARADEAAAADDLMAAGRHRDRVRADEVRLTERLDELQREVVQVRRELDDLTRSLAAAERDQQRRQRRLEQARRALRQALEHLDQP